MVEESTWTVILDIFYKEKMADNDFDKYGFSKISRMKAMADEVDRDQNEVSRALRQMGKTRVDQQTDLK